MDRVEEEKLKYAKFNHEKLLKYLQEVKGTLPDISPESFLNAMLEFVKIFSIIGSAISFAFKDIITRVGTIRNNYKRFPEVKGGLISFIEHEIKLGIHLYSTENPKPVHNRAYKDYESTTRSVNRLMWFFDFVVSLITHIETNRKMKASDCAKKAYEEALAPHHPLAIRVAAKAALTFTPSREKFFAGLFPEGMSEEEKYFLFRQCIETVAPIKEFLWRYYEDHGMKIVS